jgi:hypothetical protein
MLPTRYFWDSSTTTNCGILDAVMIVVPAIALISTGLAVMLIMVLRQMAGTKRKLPATVEWMEALSVERYRPMLRLLDREDLAFLKSQPGFRPDMAKRLRRQRCDIFIGYLRHLCSDFQLTCAALKLIMLHAPVDRPDLASGLLRAQVSFALGLLQIHLRLALYRWGLADVDVRNLVQLFDGMRLELRSMVPAAAPGMA